MGIIELLEDDEKENVEFKTSLEHYAIMKAILHFLIKEAEQLL
jgi:hypothetical protein